jgi:hypothetical protein
LPARGSFANLPEVSLTGVSPPTASALQARLEKVIRRMQKVAGLNIALAAAGFSP